MPAFDNFSTCDLCDAHKADTSGDFRVLPPMFTDYGGLSKFAGSISTVRCLEDNSRVKEAVQSAGLGRVLVVDGGRSMRRSLLGGLLAADAARNGWAGVVVIGAVRDKAELLQCKLGIRALGLIPMPTDRQNQGQRDVAIQCGEVWLQPGDWLFADEDGMVVMKPQV